MRFTLTILILGLLYSCSNPALEREYSDWRGPARDGIYSENGLMKEWPEEGPELSWTFEDLGSGHNSVAVAHERVYATGIRDSAESLGTLFVFDREGTLLWEKTYGRDFTRNFIGTRSTPVVADDYIYIESGEGTLYCLNAHNGEEIWSLDFLSDLGVDSLVQFGYAESPLIDGDRLICVPGGKENNVVALDRFTGEKIWASAGHGEQATYNSPIAIDCGSRRLIIAMSKSSIMGIDADNGEMYWRIEQTQTNNIHANTPVYSEGLLLVSSADAKSTSGLVQIRLSDEGRKAEVVWRNKRFRGFMGGLIKVDTCIYGSTAMGKDWRVMSWNTGEMLVQNKEMGGGAIIYADGMFYCFTEREGEVALVNAGPEKFEIISRFSIPNASEQHWAHPVISDGMLYIRHSNVLMAYNVKKQDG